MDLALAPGLSFMDDSSSAFPIRGKDLADGRIASDRPTAIFFGTAHCWNTNREAERFVALYRKHRDAARFLVVDLERPSPDQAKLVARFYRGYIPTLAFLDRKGDVVYDRAGETARERGDPCALERILSKAQAVRRDLTEPDLRRGSPPPGREIKSAQIGGENVQNARPTLGGGIAVRFGRARCG